MDSGTEETVPRHRLLPELVSKDLVAITLALRLLRRLEVELIARTIDADKSVVLLLSDHLNSLTIVSRYRRA